MQYETLFYNSSMNSKKTTLYDHNRAYPTISDKDIVATLVVVKSRRDKDTVAALVVVKSRLEFIYFSCIERGKPYDWQSHGAVYLFI